MTARYNNHEEQDEWEQMPLTSSLNAAATTTKSNPFHNVPQRSKTMWKSWLFLILLESSCLLWVTNHIFPLFFNNSTLHNNGTTHSSSAVGTFLSILLPLFLLGLRLGLNNVHVLIYLVHLGSFTITGVALFVAIHLSGFLNAISISVALTLTASIVALTGCLVRSRKESRCAALVTFTMSTLICSILAVASMTLVFHNSATIKNNNQTLVVMVAMVLNHHMFFSAYRVSQRIANQYVNHDLFGVATVVVVILDVVGVLYLEYLIKVFVGAVRCHKVNRIGYYPRIRGLVHSGGGQVQGVYNNDDAFDLDGRDSAPFTEEEEEDDDDDEQEREKAEKEETRHEETRKENERRRGHDASPTRDISLEVKNDDFRDLEADSETGPHNTKEEETEEQYDKETISVKNDDKDDGDEPTYVAVDDNVRVQRRGNLIRTHDTSTLWTFLDIDSDAHTVYQLDTRLFVCLYCHYSMCSFPSSSGGSGLPVRQHMALNHFRAFVNGVLRLKNRAHDTIKQGRIDRIYSTVCRREGGAMNYLSFKRALTNIRQEMNVADEALFVTAYLLPLCDVLGKEQAASNVRSMKIRAVLGQYTRSNDVRNEIVDNEKFLFALFSSYTRIVEGSPGEKGGRRTTSTATKSYLSLAQLVVMFEDFSLLPHEFDLVTLERIYRDSLLDSKLVTSDDASSIGECIDEASFHYILLSLGSAIVLNSKSKNNRKLGTGVMYKGIKYIIKCIQDDTRGKEIFFRRFKLVLPMPKTKKKKKKQGR